MKKTWILKSVTFNKLCELISIQKILFMYCSLHSLFFDCTDTHFIFLYSVYNNMGTEL